jgi:hypothetical protein
MTMLRRVPLMAAIAAVIAIGWSAVPAYAATTAAITPEVAISKKPIAVVGLIIVVLIGAGVAFWYTRRDK